MSAVTSQKYPMMAASANTGDKWMAQADRAHFQKHAQSTDPGQQN
jgi:hypothetical protein